MATESPIRITETSGTWASLKGTSAFGSSSANMAIEELGLLLKGQPLQDDGSVLVPNRSGSAPPSMEGSFAAADNIMSQQNFSLNASLASINSAINSYVSEEELNADPAYVTYSSRVNVNRRLTPPLIPRENRYLVRRIGSAGNNRRLTSYDDYRRGALLMSHSKLPTHREEPEDDKSAQHTPSNWADRSNSFTYQPEAISSSQLKTVVDMIQEDFPRTKSPIYSQGPSLILESVEEAVTRDTDCSSLHDTTLCSSNSTESIPSTDDMRQTSYSNPTESISSSSSLPSLGNTLSKKAFYRQHSNTLDTHLGDDISTSGVTDTLVTCIESNTNSVSSSPNPKDRQHIHQHYMLQEQVPHQQSYTFDVQSAQSQLTSQGINTTYIGTNQFFHGPSNFSGADVQPMQQSSGFNPPMYATAAADHMTSSTLIYPNLHPSGYFSPQYTLGGYGFQSEALSPYVAGYIPHTIVPVPFDTAARPSFSPQSSGASFRGITSHGVNMQHLNNYYGQLGNPMQPSFTDPLHMQYFQRPFGDAYGIPGQFDQLAPRAGAPGSQIIALDSQKGSELAAFSVEQKLQHRGSIGHSYMNPGRVGIPYYVGSPRDMGILQNPTSAVASPVLPGSPVGGTSFFSGTNEVRFSPDLARNSGISSGWQGQRGINDTKTFSVLEELKSGKGRRFELFDIAGHIIEFSGDQHGSRFIQQKLETCSVEEKASVFKEVLPHTSKLMTDVFGNYVIQKFFEYGSLEQRKELANQLAGQILPLSLQMYGCRVIQKALEVIELEQKIKLVHELDGHVMRCVRDQNGNHVVQKCIETIPTHQIEFIIFSFRGQVATLSTHPYGCRVIQRVLEHCTDELQSQFIVDEILESVCALAQDQYGNYVTQHVLERGKPWERSQIISKLSGHIVQLSQHKFASNVVEKCLEYGDSASLEIIIMSIPLFEMLSFARRLQRSHPCLQQAASQFRTDAGSSPPTRRRPKFAAATMRKTDDKSEWWVVDGEMHEIGENVPPRERFVIPRDNIPNKRRKQLRDQFMRRTRLVLKESEHEPWCKRYMELYQELRENWERLYWDEGYSKKLGQDHANCDSAEDDDQDFSPYRKRLPHADQMKDQAFMRNRQGDSWKKASQIRDKFEFDRERRMRDKAFAPMNYGGGGDGFVREDLPSRNRPLDAQRYFSEADSSD